MERSAYQPRLGSWHEAPQAQPLIGPNAVIQTLAALQVLVGEECRQTVARSAGLPDSEPGEMIPEASFVGLVAAVRDELGHERAAEVLSLSGKKTADYVAGNRIPGVFRGLLRLLPSRIAMPLLLGAFRRHAWTFSGRSDFLVSGDYPGSILLTDAPTCRNTGAGARTGGYYEAAFQGLLSLASPNVAVTEIECRSLGDSHCRFRISPNTRQSRG